MSSLALSPEVHAALTAGRPVVALESTIIAHGLPYPDNLAIGRELEAAVRDHGAVPATIAVFDGTARIGLDDAALQQLAEGAQQFEKASARDLGVLLAMRRNAATTVSSTMLLAARAGIRVFATGGIGGVHRGDALDVSQDLPALASYPVAVISAGAKAILDLPRTLETLETLGVPVVGHATTEFPAFYTRSSGLTIDHSLPDATAIAAFLVAHWALQPNRGVLVANPIPADDALDAHRIADAIDVAVDDARELHITGKAVTPFLLRRIAEMTKGRSVDANRALALHNARVGAAVAVALTSRGPAAAAR